jgi:hypothetical protein
MIKDLICSLDYSVCAEAALAVFVGTFFVIFYGVSRLSREATDRFASIPLTDSIEDPRDE